MSKRGQFFLVAALVIVGILIGLAGVYTQVNTTKEDSSVYDLSSELNYESLQVIDQGVFTSQDSATVNQQITGLTNYYVAKNPKKDFAIVYGDQNSITVLAYTVQPIGSVGTSTGGTAQTHTVTQTVLRSSAGGTGSDSAVIGDAVVIKFKNQTYSFKLGAGTSFYSVLATQSGDQQYVAAQGNTATTTTAPGRCSGDAPSGDNTIKGSELYQAGFTGIKSWNFVTPSTSNAAATLSPCQWTCTYNYVLDTTSGTKCKHK